MSCRALCWLAFVNLIFILRYADICVLGRSEHPPPSRFFHPKSKNKDCGGGAANSIAQLIKSASQTAGLSLSFISRGSGGDPAPSTGPFPTRHASTQNADKSQRNET